MAFASSERIKREFSRCVIPFDPARVVNAAYELAMGPEAVTTHDGALLQLAPAPESESYGEPVVIQPGQLAMLLTEEVVAIQSNIVGLISIKASIKLSGLVNVSGFHVDPGFVGRLKFTVYNAGSRPITIRRGQPTFLLWFADLGEDTADLYDGKRKGQRHIDDGNLRDFQGTLASPASLDRRITDLGAKLDTEVDKLRSDLSTIRSIAIGVGIALLGFILNRGCMNSAEESPPTAQVSADPGRTSTPAPEDTASTDTTERTDGAEVGGGDGQAVPLPETRGAQ